MPRSLRSTTTRFAHTAVSQTIWPSCNTVARLQTIELEGGIRFTAYNAGHVLGAAMFLIEIAGIKILYTGDYSREEDRHLMPAERPPGTVEVMICESTFGVQSHEPRIEREARFTSAFTLALQNTENCLTIVSSSF